MRHDPVNDALCTLIVMGVSGSGKSTVAAALAERLDWPYEDGDKFHPRSNVEKMKAGHPLTDADRLPWLQAIAAEIERVGKSGRHLIIACSALKRSYRDILVHGRHDVRLIYLDGSRDLIAKRLTQRKGHFMPPQLLDSQFRALEIPTGDERVITVSIDASVSAIVESIMQKLNTAIGDGIRAP